MDDVIIEIKLKERGNDGYHSKTLGYSIWHIFRIEDIVVHEMMVQMRQKPKRFI